MVGGAASNLHVAASSGCASLERFGVCVKAGWWTKQMRSQQDFPPLDAKSARWIHILELLPSLSWGWHSVLGTLHRNQSTTMVCFESTLKRIMFEHSPPCLYLYVLCVMIQRQSIGHCVLKIRMGFYFWVTWWPQSISVSQTLWRLDAPLCN